MTKVLWTSVAASDLQEIGEFVAADSVSAANGLLDRVDAAVAELRSHPAMGRVVPELSKHNITEYRETVLAPWRLFYRVERELVYIMSLIDGRRNIEDVLLRRLLREP